MVIDFHTHIFPEKLATKAYETLSVPARTAGYAPIHNLTKEGLLGKMDEYGVDLSVVCPVATKPTQSQKNLEWGITLRSERLTCLAGLFPDVENWKKNVDDAVSMGYKGIKLHPEYQNFIVDDENMFPLYEYAFSKDLFILFHAGYDPIGEEPFKSNPQKFARLAEEFKGARMVIAHLGGQSQWDDVEKYLVGKDVYLDTAMGFGFFSKEQFLRILSAHGSDKILFGSDSPWSNTGRELLALRSLPIDDEEKENILCKNAKKLLDIL
ncbi:MAG: amidohydrolase family protein [Clostridia bacterium]|nr:amidohydrolase family protein [Clostridia bacterium]